jgi:thioesterase domain-containing protein
MKEVEHGVTVDNVAYEMARKMQSNETTLHFLAALDFDGEPGEEAVNDALDEAANGTAEAIAPEAKPAAPVTPADLERADVASARAAQWVERAEGQKPKPATAGSEEFEKHVEAGNVDAMTQAFLADLLES